MGLLYVYAKGTDLKKNKIISWLFEFLFVYMYLTLPMKTYLQTLDWNDATIQGLIW